MAVDSPLSGYLRTFLGDTLITKNTLFYGDNLSILREYIPDEIDGANVKMPPTGITFKQAQRMKETGPTQKSLFD